MFSDCRQDQRLQIHGLKFLRNAVLSSSPPWLGRLLQSGACSTPLRWEWSQEQSPSTGGSPNDRVILSIYGASTGTACRRSPQDPTVRPLPDLQACLLSGASPYPARFLRSTSGGQGTLIGSRADLTRSPQFTLQQGAPEQSLQEHSRAARTRQQTSVPTINETGRSSLR